MDVFLKLNYVFKKDYKLECVDFKYLFYICVCIIVKVKGVWFRMYFDGWFESYDFWINWDLFFIFFMGWCDKNG